MPGPHVSTGALLVCLLAITLAAIPAVVADDSAPEPKVKVDEEAPAPPAPKAEAPPPAPSPPPSKPKAKKKLAECSFKGDDWKKALTQSEKMWAGSVARCIAQTLLHPLDTIRTRRQVKGGLPTSALDTSKGLIPQMAGAMPAGALQFMAYENSKEKLQLLLKNHTLGGLKPHVIEIASSSLGAAAASLVRVPQERIKQPVQADIYPNFMAAIAGNMNEGGLPAFFTGFTATIMRDVPWNALSFTFFNIFKMIYEQMQNKAPAQRDTMALAALGGTLAAVIMTPVDVVKTRLMLQKPDENGELAYKGIAQALGKIALEEGPGALLKGVTPRCLYLGPLASITFSFYERIGKSILLKRGPDWCRSSRA